MKHHLPHFFFTVFKATHFKKWFFCLFLLLSASVMAQPRLLNSAFINQSGTGGNADYGTGFPFENSNAGGFRSLVVSPNAGGDVYFRFRNTSSTEREPQNNGDYVPVNQNSPYTTINSGNSKAWRINANAAYRYIFRTNDGVTQIAIIEIQGNTIRTISSVSQNPATVYPAQAATVTANLSGTPAGGQAVYLRYSTVSNFASSTILKMTGAGTVYTATIPASVNAPGSNVFYYVFTSGDYASVMSPADADLLTINLNNNSNSNYSYTVQSSYVSSSNGLWNQGSTWAGGNVPADNVPVIVNHNVTLNTDTRVSQLTIGASGTFNGSDGTVRTLTVEGNLQNNGTFNATPNGKVVFKGASRVVSGTITFNDVDIDVASSVDFGIDASVARRLTLLASSFVFNNAPSYLTGSTLVYNTGGVYNRSTEWRNTPVASRVKSVLVRSGTQFNLEGSNAALSHTIDGNLTVESNATFTMGNKSAPFNVLGNITLQANASMLLGNNIGGDLTLEGNFSNDGAFFGRGRQIEFRGSNNQLLSGSAVSYFQYMMLNKTVGTTLTLAGTVSLVNNGATAQLRIQSGLLDMAGANIISNDSTVTKNLYIDENDLATLKTGGSSLAVFNRFTNDGVTLNRLGGTVEYSGSSNENIISVTYRNLVASGSGNKSTQANTQVSKSLALNGSKIVTTSTRLLILQDNATSSPGMTGSFVDGPMRKIGDDEFVFPVGKGSTWARLGISALSTPNVNDHFTVEYFDTRYSDVTSVTPPLDNVSYVEYWDVTRGQNAGGCNCTGAKITLYWQDGNRSGINDLSDLRVAHYKGGSWQNESNQGTMGTTLAGAITSQVINSFSPITFGSEDPTVNLLPIELTYFDITKQDEQAILAWGTEKKEQSFDIQRSVDGYIFETIGQLHDRQGTGKYTFTDPQPMPGLSYYRLLHTDAEQQRSCSRLLSFFNDEKNQENLLIFPNPSEGHSFSLLLYAGLQKYFTVQVSTTAGTVLMEKKIDVLPGQQEYLVLLPHRLTSGIYQVKIAEFNIHQKLIVK